MVKKALERQLKRYKYRNGPNRLLEPQVWKLDDESTLGFVVLETDHGFVEFAINRGGAEELSEALDDFLTGKSEKFPQK